MNQALVDTIVQAVLYEGYILYPYRASTKKNRQRFTFGRIYPEAYSLAQKSAEPCAMQTECLVEIKSPDDALEVIVRFLHPMERQMGALDAPLADLPEGSAIDFFRPVPELKVGERLYQSWTEAVERAVHVPVQSLAAPVSITVPFSFPATTSLDPVRDENGQIAAVIARRQETAEGRIELTVGPVDVEAAKITVRILNQSPVSNPASSDEATVVMNVFASTHTILHTRGAAEFISQIDPPKKYAEAAATCRQLGTWPILVGDEAKEERDTMVSSPIILYDYPKIAPESPGDLFDGGEIDEILSLRILTMTDEEKKEMRGVDERARQILERTENLEQEQLLQMHGAMRETASAEDFFNPASKPKSFLLGGVPIKTGDRVRVRPRARADIMDMAFAGKIAIVETIEQDAEDKIHLALVLEDDPGKDLGFLRQPGHRFFYGVDEVEALREGE